MFLLEIASMSSYEFAQFQYFQIKQARAGLVHALNHPDCSEEQKESLRSLLRTLEEDQREIVRRHGIMEH